jgi:peptide/nickel transport system ATP-binding protein
LITHDLGIVAAICDDVAIMYAGRLVETADLRSLYKKPLHPYTRGLFDAVPRLDADPAKRLAVIPGLTPDPTNLPKGCSFSPRCPWARDICREKSCGMKEYEPGHFVDCHFPLLDPLKSWGAKRNGERDCERNDERDDGGNNGK